MEISVIEIRRFPWHLNLITENKHRVMEFKNVTIFSICFTLKGVKKRFSYSCFVSRGLQNKIVQKYIFKLVDTRTLGIFWPCFTILKWI